MTNIKVRNIFGQAVWQVAVAALAGAALLAQPAPPDQVPAQPLTPDQLDTLVAPVALYPDALLGQILAAATYPLEVTEAAQWLQQHSDLRGQQLMEAARQQNWAPSVQALVAFPDVVSRLASDIRWTTDLGNAFLQQQADVMAAVQRMRTRAMAAGKLSSNAQQTVTEQAENGQQAIEIQPANPDVVYVPYYNPVYVWGPPAWGYYPAWDDWGFGFGWGPGIYIGGLFPGLFWGGWGWGCNWFHGFIFERPFFFAHYGFHGFYGGRAWGAYTVWAHDPAHRLGVAYSTHALSARYGAASTASRALNGGHFNNGRYTAPAGGGNWNHFNSAQANVARSGSASSGYRASASPAYRGSQSYSRGYSYSAPSSNSYSGSRSYSYSTPRSYSYSAPRGNSYSAPRGNSYSAPRGNSYSAPRSSGGGSSGRSYSGAGGGFHGGGGGGSHGGGGHR